MNHINVKMSLFLATPGGSGTIKAMTINSLPPVTFLPLDSLTRFTVVLFVVLFLPRLMERIKLPGLVGLIIGGLILGPILTQCFLGRLKMSASSKL
jgi:hypothetical protein